MWKGYIIAFTILFAKGTVFTSGEIYSSLN